MNRSLAGLAIALVLCGAPASAQTYPSKPITMIVPFAAGGATDVLARFLGERMRAILGQTVVVENVTGAGGSIGVGRAVRAPADGYTLEMGTSTTNMLLGGLYPLQFDLINDLSPIILIASEPLLIVGKKNLRAQNLKELIAWLKADPSGGRRHRPPCRSVVSQRDRRQSPVHSVPWQRPGAPRPGGRPDRSADRACLELLCPGQGGRDQTLRRHVEGPQRGGK
jgi:hypothetical protein